MCLPWVTPPTETETETESETETQTGSEISGSDPDTVGGVTDGIGFETDGMGFETDGNPSLARWSHSTCGPNVSDQTGSCTGSLMARRRDSMWSNFSRQSGMSRHRRNQPRMTFSLAGFWCSGRCGMRMTRASGSKKKCCKPCLSGKQSCRMPSFTNSTETLSKHSASAPGVVCRSPGRSVRRLLNDVQSPKTMMPSGGSFRNHGSPQ